MIKVVTDSTSDLPEDLIRQYRITVVPVSLTLNGKQYLDRIDITTDEILPFLANTDTANLATSSPPSVLAFEQVYRQLQRERPCDGIVSIHVSAKLSGSFNAALMAREAFSKSALPVAVIDSTLGSMGVGLIVVAAARAAQQGASWNEVNALIKRMIPQTHVAFIVDSLEYLHKSERIGHMAPLIDSLLPLKPLLSLDEGQITLFERTRTRYKALDALYTFIEDFPHIENLVLLHVNSLVDANNLAERCLGKVPRDKIRILQYGPASALSLGRGAVGAVIYEG